MTTGKLKVLKRSNRLVYDSMTDSSYLSNNFFKQIVPLWNNFPSGFKTKNWTYDTIKVKFKDFFRDKLNIKLTHQNSTRNLGRTTVSLNSLISSLILSFIFCVSYCFFFNLNLYTAFFLKESIGFFT